MKKQNITRILWNITGQKFVHSTEESENELYLDIRFYIFCFMHPEFTVGKSWGMLSSKSFHIIYFTFCLKTQIYYKNRKVIKTEIITVREDRLHHF